ncbi:MAG: TonB family protein [Flavobacteriaceae bacterium]|nr:TonB family protein [Flavobacteriaceae bacterium]
MHVKKNPRKDLNRKSQLYFQIGLILVLFLTFLSFELKTSSSEISEVYSGNPEMLMEPEMPLIEIQEPEPPAAKPKQPEKIDVRPDDDDIIEVDILAQDVTQDTPVAKVEDIPFIKPTEDVRVPYEFVEQIPLFPGCEKVAKNQQRACFQDKMTEHVKKNFRYPQDAIDLNVQGRVYIQFIIDQQGNITDIQMRGPDSRLETEAGRIISKLPKMIPGKQGGKAVKVPYSLPINFILQK